MKRKCPRCGKIGVPLKERAFLVPHLEEKILCRSYTCVCGSEWLDEDQLRDLMQRVRDADRALEHRNHRRAGKGLSDG